MNIQSVRAVAVKFGLFCVSALLLASCASQPNTAQDQGDPGVSTAMPETGSSTGAAKATSRLTEVYVVPGPEPQDDGTLYVHDADAAASTDQSLGQGTDAELDPATVAGSQSPSLMHWYSTNSHQTMLGRPGREVVEVSADAASPGADPGVPLTSLQVDGTKYVQRGNSVIAIADGSVTRRYSLPKLQPDPVVGRMPPGYTGLYEGAQVGTVSALVPTVSGDVLAFSFTGLAAGVTDLMTGKTVEIPGYSRLGSAVRTSSGNLLVVAWDAQSESKPIQMLSLDPTTNRVAATIDTGLAATNHLRDTLLPGLGYDAVLAVSHGDSGADVGIQVWTITGQSLKAAPSLPTGSGLAIAPASTSSVYVYGGPAKNRVGLLDLASGTFTPSVPELQAPAGSYVVGVFS